LFSLIWTGLTGFSGLFFIFHHFPEESDETQSRLTAGKITQFFYWLQHIYLTNIAGT
jgi:hypothetical protein